MSTQDEAYAGRACIGLREALGLLPGVPAFESPFFAPAWRAELGDRAYAVAAALRERGVAEIELAQAGFDRLCEEIRTTLGPRFDWEAWRATGAADMRLQDAWRDCAAVRALAIDDGVAELLSQVYGRPMFPFQTLNFACGSQQHPHADSVHFNTIPDGFMCGVWVALEDVSAEAGPLVYAPGSHRWRFADNLDIGAVAGDGPDDQSRFHRLWKALLATGGGHLHSFLPRRGRALIWSAHLLHGGALHRAIGRTRWSQVTHYFGEGCIYHTPMLGNPAVGPVALRNPVDLRSGAAMANRYVGRDVAESALRGLAGLAARREEFDAARYLALNPDVAAAGADPYDHYLRHGRLENRRIR